MSRVFPVILLILSALLATACGPDIPEGWESLVPEEGLEMAIELDDSELYSSPPTLMLLYETEEVSLSELRSHFADRIEDEGFTLISDCEVSEGGGVYDVYAKEPTWFISVNAYELTPETLDARLERTDKIISAGLPENYTCKWNEAAEQFCTIRDSGFGPECEYKMAEKE